MPSESEIIIAFVFNRSGKTKLDFSEMYLSLSMSLNWFTPNQAKDFVNMALKQKLLKKEDDLLKPAFDYKKIVVPVGFYPSKKGFEEKKEKETVEEDIFKIIVKKIVEKTQVDEERIIDEINHVEKEKNITLEVAALLVGKKYDIDLEDFFEKVEEKIFA